MELAYTIVYTISRQQFKGYCTHFVLVAGDKQLTKNLHGHMHVHCMGMDMQTTRQLCMSIAWTDDKTTVCICAWMGVWVFTIQKPRLHHTVHYWFLLYFPIIIIILACLLSTLSGNLFLFMGCRDCFVTGMLSTLSDKEMWASLKALRSLLKDTSS